jgi:hypothetical protein
VARIPLLIVVVLVLMGPGSLSGQAQQPASGQSPKADEPVSADRIREGLRRPELQIPPLPPPPLTFRSEVQVTLETPLDVVRRELQEEAKVHFRTPVTKGLAEVDVLPALVGLVNKIKTIRRQHAEAEARTMVERELAEFCSTHDCSDVEREPISEGVIVP